MTKLLYLSDTYVFEDTATILDIREIEGQQTLVLDQTIFYPQGGGQPSDTGLIKNESGEMRIEKVRLNECGEVLHFGAFTSGSFEKDQEVHISIDEEKRKMHARLHTAGHFLDIWVNALAPSLRATKGYHFPEGPFVEYEGNTDDIHTEKMKTQLQEMIDQNLPIGIDILANELTEEEMKAKNITAPLGKKARLVSIGNLHECGCGGTHVKNTKEIGKMVIRKVSSKGNMVRVSYDVG